MIYVYSDCEETDGPTDRFLGKDTLMRFNTTFYRSILFDLLSGLVLRRTTTPPLWNYIYIYLCVFHTSHSADALLAAMHNCICVYVCVIYMVTFDI